MIFCKTKFKSNHIVDKCIKFSTRFDRITLRASTDDAYVGAISD